MLEGMSLEQMLALQAEILRNVRENPALKDKRAEILAVQQDAVREIRAHADGITNALRVFADHVSVETMQDASRVVSVTSPDFGNAGGSVALAAVKIPGATIRVSAVFEKE